MKENKNNADLFSDQSDEFLSLDDEQILLEPDENVKRHRNSHFGVKMILLVFFLLVAVLFVSLAMFYISKVQDQAALSSDDSSAASLETSQVFLENMSSEEEIVFSDTEESREDSAVSQEDSTDEAEQDKLFHGWIINNMGYTYLYQGVGVEQFNYSSATLQKYITCINALADQVPDGINIYCMPIPTRVGFLYSEISNEIKNQDNFFNSSQETFLDTLDEKLDGSISFINLYDPFAGKYEEGKELFFNTDLNWTSEAAYLAYENFCSASNNVAAAIEAYEQKTIDGFLGTFYTATSSDILERNADTFRYYKNSYTDACTVTLYSGNSVYKNYTLANNAVYGYSGAYSVYLGTAGQHFKIETANKSGKKLLVVGDGSAAAMMPFLVTNYTEIHYIDVALYQQDFSDLFASEGYTDVLFISYVTNAVKGIYPNYLAAMAGVTQNG